MIAFIDNKDSFTFNIVQDLERVSGKEVRVFRSEETSVAEIENAKPECLVVGPGPGRPEEAGISVEAIRHFAGKLPILGICLGHQAIGAAFGAKIINAKHIRHGIVEDMKTDGRGLFRITGLTGTYTRYHSLVIDEKTLSSDFEVTAKSSDGDIMGIRHKKYVIEGVQFHPESIASEDGDNIFAAFLHYRRENMNVSEYLNQLLSGKHLTEEQAAFFADSLTDGTMDEKVMAAVLTAMAANGLPSAGEMAGFAKTLLSKKTPFPMESRGLAEIVGTGGDGKKSFNISSLSALTAASCGLSVAKHGNRAVSSKSGAADFFENMGIKIDNNPAKSADQLKKTGFVFLMAPVYHAAMRFAGPVRKALGIKTIFNVMGPLLNPAGAEYEVLGVYSKDLLEDYARAAKSLGAKRVMTVCSRDGYDEISPCAVTDVFQINEDGKEYRYTIDPEKFGISGMKEEDLLGGTGGDNAALAKDILEGKGRPAIRAAVGLNTGALLYLAGKAKTIKEGYDMALSAIDSGKTKEKIAQIQAESNSLPPKPAPGSSSKAA